MSEHKSSHDPVINGVSRISEVGGEAAPKEDLEKKHRVNGSQLTPRSEAERGGGVQGGNQKVVDIINSLRPERPVDEVWDQLVEECGATTSEMTKSERGRYNKAVKELKEVGATPEDIHKRAAVYRRTYPNLHVTPNALVAHWSRCKPPKPVVQPHFAASQVTVNQEQNLSELQRLRKLL